MCSRGPDERSGAKKQTRFSGPAFQDVLFLRIRSVVELTAYLNDSAATIVHFDGQRSRPIQLE